jgi:hypothetical protein
MPIKQIANPIALPVLPLQVIKRPVPNATQAHTKMMPTKPVANSVPMVNTKIKQIKQVAKTSAMLALPLTPIKRRVTNAAQAHTKMVSTKPVANPVQKANIPPLVEEQTFAMIVRWDTHNHSSAKPAATLSSVHVVQMATPRLVATAGPLAKRIALHVMSIMAGMPLSLTKVLAKCLTASNA